MLVLTRKNQESVVMGGGGGLESLLKVTVLEIAGGKVKLGFEVAADIPVHRWEVWQRICAEDERKRRLDTAQAPTSPTTKHCESP